MAVRIRLARFGCRNRPFYRLMAADSKSLRDGRHLEVLGFYDPLSGEDGVKRTGLNVDRVKYWLSVGAQPSEAVWRILRKAGILPLKPVPAATHKSALETISGLFPTPEYSQDADEQEMPQPLPLCLGVPLPGHAVCDLKTGPEL